MTPVTGHWLGACTDAFRHEPAHLCLHVDQKRRGRLVEHNASRLAAALAYYTLLSVAPLAVIAIGVAGLVFGQDAARGQVADRLGAVVGQEAAEGVQSIVANARFPEAGFLSITIGVVVLFLGASGVFGELQASLNAIWDVEPKPGRGLWGTVRDRFFSFSMVLGVAFLLLVSLVVSTALSALGHYFQGALPGGEIIWQILNFVISLGTVTLLFALLFKVIPDVEIQWRDVWLGALFTAMLFTLGKFGLGLYLGKASVGSPYGAAGSLVVLAVWVYYAAQILLFGAELTQVFAKQHGRDIRPSDGAVRVGPAHPAH